MARLPRGLLEARGNITNERSLQLSIFVDKSLESLEPWLDSEIPVIPTILFEIPELILVNSTT